MLLQRGGGGPRGGGGRRGNRRNDRDRNDHPRDGVRKVGMPRALSIQSSIVNFFCDRCLHLLPNIYVPPSVTICSDLVGANCPLLDAFDDSAEKPFLNTLLTRALLAFIVDQRGTPKEHGLVSLGLSHIWMLLICSVNGYTIDSKTTVSAENSLTSSSTLTIPSRPTTSPS